MNKLDVPYGQDFELIIPGEPEVPGYLSLSIDQDGTSMTVLADDCDGSRAMVFISTEAQALMVIAAMQMMIGRLRNSAKEESEVVAKIQ